MHIRRKRSTCLTSEEGLPFTYATARSVHSARIVAAGLQTRLPVITYNGVFLQDAQTGKVLSRTVFHRRRSKTWPGIYRVIR